MTGQLFFLFFLFAKIAAFTFGGGYAMIPLFESELVDRYGFLTAQQFADMVALAQMTPGPIGLNAATYIGYQQAGIAGAAAATLGVSMPSLILMTLAAAFLTAFRENPLIRALLNGVRPATAGLVAAAVVFFADISLFTAPLRDLFSGGSTGICWQACVVFAAVLAVEWKWECNLFFVLAGAVLLTLFLFLI